MIQKGPMDGDLLIPRVGDGKIVQAHELYFSGDQGPGSLDGEGHKVGIVIVLLHETRVLRLEQNSNVTFEIQSSYMLLSDGSVRLNGHNESRADKKPAAIDRW